MARDHPRAIVVGVDSVSMKLLERFAQEGSLPHTAALMARGASLHAMACLPAYTPTNWATLATGAWPGTHGAGNWYDAAPSDPPDRSPLSTFDSRAITAETVWEAAERQGLASLAIAYPGSYPSRLQAGMIVAPLPNGLWSWDLVPGCEYCAGVRKPGSVSLTLRPAEDRPNRPAGSLEAVLSVARRGTGGADAVGAVEDGAVGGREAEKAESAGLWVLLPKGGAGYDRVLVFDAPNSRRPVAEMRPGQWSEWAFLQFPTESGPRPASVRFKLLELTPDGKRMRLLRSALYPTTDFSDPAELSPQLVKAVGPYFEHAAMADPSDLSIYDEWVYEEMAYQVDWHARAAAHLFDLRGWDLFYNHWHFPDSVQHHFMSQADPSSPHFDPVHGDAYLSVLRRACELGDQLLGGLMRLAGPDTYVALVSDHGNASNRYVCHLGRRLQEVGLLRRTGPRDEDPIDWANTLAYPHGSFQVNVNLRGREAQGSVETPEYDRVVGAIIDALYDWRTEDGLRPVAFALRKKDAAMVGYWGDRTGDVVFIYNAGFAWGDPAGSGTTAPAPPGANHGPQVVTAETSLSSNLAAWVIAGPGVRPGYQRDMSRLGPARLIDFVPTLCHALGVNPPADCQGAVEYDIFEH